MAGKLLDTARSILRFEGADPVAYWRRFAVLLAMSAVIATMGLIRNSGAVVIAAMLIAPLMTPILGVASAMISGRIRRALRLFAFVTLAAAASVLLAFTMMFVADVPRGVVIPSEVRARTDPGIEDLIVALMSGLAAAYVQINRGELSLLPGAAIGVSLVPPLAAAGILLYFGEPQDAYGAVLLFLTNLAAIILSASGVYAFYALRVSSRARRRRFTTMSVSLLATLALMGAVAIPLATETVHRFREVRFEQATAAALRSWAGPTPVEIIRINVNARRKIADLWLIVDVPHTNADRIVRPDDMLPQHLQAIDLSDVLRSVLGSDFKVAVRYQYRYAGEVDLWSQQIEDAPVIEEDVAD